MHIRKALLLCALTAIPELVSAQKKLSPGEKISAGGQLLDSVAVVGRKTNSGAGSLSGEDLERTRGGSLAEIIRSVPGVTMLQTGATITKPVIHGMYGNRILILNNGIRQEGQQWGSEHAPEIDPFVAGRITVIKGAETIRFGPNAIGGVVMVEPPPLPETPELHSELQLTASGNSRAGAFSGALSGGIHQLPGFGWRLQGTFKRAGNFRAANYYLENTGLRELNFSAAAGYTAGKLKTELYFSRFHTGLGIFQGAHIGNLSDLKARIENGRPGTKGKFSYDIGVPRQRVSHELLKFKGEYRFADRLRFGIQYGLQLNRRGEYDIRRGNRNGVPSMNLELTTQTLDVFLEKLTGQNWKNTLGISAVNQVNNTIEGTFATPLIPNFDSYGAGIYFIRKLVKQEYELEAGLRYDYQTLDALGYDRELNFYGGTRDFHNISASAGGLWRMNERWSLHSRLALAWRPPTVNELYSNGLHHGTASYELGNGALKGEQSSKWTGTLTHYGSRLQTGLDVYIHWFKNYIYLNPAKEYVTTMQGSFPTFNYEQTSAMFRGIDLYGSYRISQQVDYEFKSSLVRAKDTSHDRYLPWVPSDRFSSSLRWNLKTGTRHRDGPGAYLQLQHEYAARQTRYEPGTDFAAPPPAYHLWHLHAATGWEREKHTLRLHLSVRNLFNALYKEYMNRFRYYAHDRGRNITLRISCSF